MEGLRTGMRQDLHEAIEGLRADTRQDLHEAIEGLRADTRQDLHEAIDGLRADTRQDLHEAIGGLRADTRQDLHEAIDGLRGEMAARFVSHEQMTHLFTSHSAEIRRHFDIVAESLRTDIRVIAEGHVYLVERLDRLERRVPGA
jgi:hypothetical protein